MARLVGPGCAGVGFESVGDAAAAVVGWVEIEQFEVGQCQTAGDLEGLA